MWKEFRGNDSLDKNMKRKKGLRRDREEGIEKKGSRRRG
jgi:hypothetical protein